MKQANAAAINFGDEKQCLSLLSGLPLTKLDEVHATLAALLSGMQATPPMPSAYLEVLEMARPLMAFAQEEMAERYAQTALPPDSPHEATLGRVVSLWQAMAGAYAQVAQLGGENPEVQTRLALICQRCIHYSGNALQEYLRARRDVALGVWSDVHGYYSTAEEWGIAQVEVAETLIAADHKQSSAQAYAAILLLDLGNPYGRSPREFRWLLRWSQSFAGATDVMAVEQGGDDQIYAVDLSQDRGLAPLDVLLTADQSAREQLRRLDTTRLSKALRRLLSKLKHKVPPAQLGLGGDCIEPDSTRLLLSLYRPWCSAPRARRHPRRKAEGTAHLCYGFEAIYYHVAGTEFMQPEHVREYSREDLDALVTFRHQVDPVLPLHIRAAQVGYNVENWAVADESIGGFRLLRFGTGVRIEYSQLIGLRPPDGQRVLLCQVSWIMYLATGALAVGVSLLPGIPEPIAARQTGVGVAKTEKYSRAFILPPLPALQQETTLVLPKVWFHPGRVVEVCSDRRVEVRLVDSLTQGLDFDRVSFSPLGGVS